ncbi:PaaI family thioesterase [Nocardioides marmoriginsengisoli]|uniref:Acyl-coenzyme A thioesterase THEM4 n=2 Tax=Nocardioides marmoriginsengisoli TaxID=661483 RepID=A0A3N0CGQ7_9ACTN|nr:PaaI family thioesterase [Nocardioides marmoriginsengisoli]
MFRFVDLSDAEVDALEARYGPLGASLRELVDAAIRTNAGDAEVRDAVATIEALTEKLRIDQIEGASGVHYNEAGRSWSWGNAAIGLRNAVAPPMDVQQSENGDTYAEVHLGAAYEGPPGMVHGGVSALLLDHLMGVTASRMTKVTFTGTLTLKYRNPLPLGRVVLSGEVSGEEGRKVFVAARIEGDQGIAVEADGIFIVPVWSE